MCKSCPELVSAPSVFPTTHHKITPRQIPRDWPHKRAASSPQTSSLGQVVGSLAAVQGACFSKPVGCAPPGKHFCEPAKEGAVSSPSGAATLSYSGIRLLRCSAALTG
jgi:hypothetical protein